MLFKLPNWIWKTPTEEYKEMPPRSYICIYKFKKKSYMSLTTKKEKIAKYRLRPRFFPMQINTTKNRHRKCGKSNEWHNIGTHWGNVWAQKWFFSSQLWQRIFEIAFSKLTLKWHSSVPNVYISDNNQKLYYNGK